ncbi:uncharacterized protein [Ovis canadensis]|uniref:uncharacterized protein n=1 Tax=Ovis canadensis TaxID=37174 RepID=UPI00375343B3
MLAQPHLLRELKGNSNYARSRSRAGRRQIVKSTPAAILAALPPALSTLAAQVPARAAAGGRRGVGPARRHWLCGCRAEESLPLRPPSARAPQPRAAPVRSTIPADRFSCADRRDPERPRGARRSPSHPELGSRQGTSGRPDAQAKRFEELTTHTFMVLFKEASLKCQWTPGTCCLCLETEKLCCASVLADAITAEGMLVLSLLSPV